MAERESGERSSRGRGIARIRDLVRSDLSRRLLALAALSIGTALLVVDFVRLPAREYVVGEVADRDIRATRTFEYVDEEETAARRAAAEDAVLPVFDFDSTLAGRLQARIATAFDTARSRYSQALLDARAEGKDDLASEQLAVIARDFLALLELSIDPEELDLVTRARWSRLVEQTANDLLSEAMRAYIIGDPATLPTGATAITVVRILGEQRDEVQLDDLSQIRTPPTARQSIWLSAQENAARTVAADDLRAAVAIARAALRPNFSFNQLMTQDRRQAARARVGESANTVTRGTVLVREGDVLDRQQVEMIRALKSSRSGFGMVGVVLALVAFSGMVYLSLYQFGAGFIRKFSTRPRDLEAVAVLTLLVLASARVVVEASSPLSGALGMGLAPTSFWFLVPFAGGAMLVRILVNSETTIVWTLASASLAGVMLDQQVLFALFFAVSGVTAAGGIAYTKERVNVLRAGVLTGFINAAGALLLNLFRVHLGDVGATAQAATQPLWDVGYAFAGGVLSAIMVLGLVPVFELFGFVTDYKLLELSNLNHPLLRQLMLRAPGTYHHSVTVAQLCEAAAEAVGANALQTRVACYFHDIGKAVQPRYFIENQRGGPNPHDRLTAQTSARIIINHVVDGTAIARQYKLPQPILDAIRMHHGTGIIQYFYAKSLREAPPGTVVEDADFRYPGVLPDTREAGIIMLADRVEAACRTLRDKSPENIRGLIQKLVNSAIVDGQLELCPLTVKELYTIVEAFSTTLLGIYHQRIEYPGVPVRPQPAPAAVTTSGPIITLELPSPFEAEPTRPTEDSATENVAPAGETTDPDLTQRDPTDPQIRVEDDYEAVDHLAGPRRRRDD